MTTVATLVNSGSNLLASRLSPEQMQPSDSNGTRNNSSPASYGPAIVLALSADATAHLGQTASSGNGTNSDPVGSAGTSESGLASAYQTWASIITDPNASDEAKVAAYGAYTAIFVQTSCWYGHTWFRSDLDNEFSKETASSSFMTKTVGDVITYYGQVETNYLNATGSWGANADLSGMPEAIAKGGDALSGTARQIYDIYANAMNEADVLSNTPDLKRSVSIVSMTSTSSIAFTETSSPPADQATNTPAVPSATKTLKPAFDTLDQAIADMLSRPTGQATSRNKAYAAAAQPETGSAPSALLSSI